uniref:Uncharacterized protein n=1 Tax=Moniliophthora roreri TaxID=221103 RepID=A0A0W0GC66_MONRR
MCSKLVFTRGTIPLSLARLQGVFSTSISIDIIYSQRSYIHFGVLVSNSRSANVTMIPTSPSPSPSPSTCTLALDPALILYEGNRRQYKFGLGVGPDLPSSVSLSGSFDFSPCLSPRRLGEGVNKHGGRSSAGTRDSQLAMQDTSWPWYFSRRRGEYHDYDIKPTWPTS